MKYLSIGILRTRPRKVSVVPPGEVGSAAAVQPAEEPEAVDPGGAVGAVHKDDAAAVVLAKYTKVADGADGTNNYTAPAKLAGAAANLAAAVANRAAAAPNNQQAGENFAAARRTVQPHVNPSHRLHHPFPPGTGWLHSAGGPSCLVPAPSADVCLEPVVAVHLHRGVLRFLVLEVVGHPPRS